MGRFLEAFGGIILILLAVGGFAYFIMAVIDYRNTLKQRREEWQQRETDTKDTRNLH